MKTALVLGGGGGKGAYQIGVWKALRDMKIEINMVYGSSVGALNGILVAQNSYNEAVDIWLSNTTTKIFSINPSEDVPLVIPFKDISGLPMEEIFGYAQGIVNGGADSSGLREIIEKALDENTLRNSTIDFGINITTASSMKKNYTYLSDIPHGKVIDYILASAACFPVAHSVSIDGVSYVDGGLSDNLPVTMAVDMGADQIICVDLYTVGLIPKQRIELAKDLAKDFKYIKPKWDIGNVLFFDEKVSRQSIVLGYIDCMKSFGKLIGDKYAFKLDTFKSHNTNKVIVESQMLSIFEHLAAVFEFSPFKVYDMFTFNETLSKKIKPWLNTDKFSKQHVLSLVDSIGLLSSKERVCRIAVDIRALGKGSVYLTSPLYKFIQDDIAAAEYLAYNLL